MKKLITASALALSAVAVAAPMASAAPVPMEHECWEGNYKKICLNANGLEGTNPYLHELGGTIEGAYINVWGHFDFRWRSGGRDWYKSTPDAFGGRTENVSVAMNIDPGTLQCVRYWMKENDSYTLRNDWHCFDGKK